MPDICGLRYRQQILVFSSCRWRLKDECLHVLPLESGVFVAVYRIKDIILKRYGWRNLTIIYSTLRPIVLFSIEVQLHCLFHSIHGSISILYEVRIKLSIHLSLTDALSSSLLAVFSTFASLISSTLWLFISLSSCYTFPISYGNLVLDQNNFTWYVWVFLFPVCRIINSYNRKRLRFDVTYGRLKINQSRRQNSFRFVF